MNIKISDFYNVLQADLKCSNEINYTVCEFCQRVEISRATFYRSYKSLSDVYQLVIGSQVEQRLNGGGQLIIYRRYRNLLEYLDSDANLLRSIYLQTERLFFYDVLEPLIFKNLRSYYQNSVLTDVAIKMICTPITHTIVRYIDHNFEQDINDVYIEIYRILAVAENVQEMI